MVASMVKQCKGQCILWIVIWFFVEQRSVSIGVKKQINETQVLPSEKTFIISKKEDMKPIGMKYSVGLSTKWNHV
jgi:hypothetical protein